MNVIKSIDIKFKQIKSWWKNDEGYEHAFVKLVECHTCHLGFLIITFYLSFGGHWSSILKVLPATMLIAHEASKCLPLFPWFMKTNIAISWFQVLEIHDECLPVSDCFSERIFSLIIDKESFYGHHTVLAANNVEFFFFENWPIYFSVTSTTRFLGVTQIFCLSNLILFICHHIPFSPFALVFILSDPLWYSKHLREMWNTFQVASNPLSSHWTLGIFLWITRRKGVIFFLKRVATVNVELTTGSSVSPEDSIGEWKRFLS